MDTILIVAAVILLGLAAFGVNLGRVQSGWLGLALYVVTALTP